MSDFESFYEQTAGLFTLFAELEGRELPLYSRLARAAAADPELLTLMQAAPKGQRRPTLLFAAVHHLLLGGAKHELAAWYPTVSGAPTSADADPAPAFADFVARHRDEIVDRLRTRTTQTNEVNRSCLWFVAARDAAADLPDRPLGIVEVGSSAGLNLGFDRYAYDFGDGAVRGRADSAVRLGSDVRGAGAPLDAPLPDVVARVGLDVAPVDPHDREAVGWLEACLWPEQLERFERFRAAVASTRASPPDVVTGDAVDDLQAAIRQVPDDAHLVVVHSWALTYVERGRRAHFEAALDEIGHGRDLTWLSAEHPGCMATVPIPADMSSDVTPTAVARQRWRGGRAVDTEPVVVAVVHPHLAWLEWRGG